MHLYVIGCMESAKWVTPAHWVPLLFVLAYAFRAVQELTFPAAEGSAAGR